MKWLRVIKGSFWVVAAVHIAVFTVIGFLTSSWRLLGIFIAGFLATMAVWAAVKVFAARRRIQKHVIPGEGGE